MLHDSTPWVQETRQVLRLGCQATKGQREASSLLHVFKFSPLLTNLSALCLGEKISVFFLLGAKFTAGKSVEMLLTGQLHLGAEHDFARPLKNVCVFPSCAHTSFVTLLKGMASGSTQPHSQSKLEACSMDGVFQPS